MVLSPSVTQSPHPDPLSAAVADHGFVQVAGFAEHLSVEFNQGMERLVVAMGTGSRHKITIPFYQYSSASSMVEWSPSIDDKDGSGETKIDGETVRSAVGRLFLGMGGKRSGSAR